MTRHEIVEITASTVNIPFVAPVRWSGGVEDGWSRTIVEVRTSSGLVGIGETQGGEFTRRLIESDVAPKFLGLDPFRIEEGLARLTFLGFYHGKTGMCAQAAVEMACWDLAGKIVDRPVCELLGGRFRSEVPVASYIFYRYPDDNGRNGIRTPQEVIDYTVGLHSQHDFKTIKFKGGVFPPEVELEALRALRAQFPTHRLRYDPNALLSVATAIRLVPALEELAIEYYEDPVWGNEAMSQVRSRTRLPMATNMCVINHDQLADAIRVGAVDIVLADICNWGGITATRKLLAVCDTFQLGVGMHSGGEIGIATAAYLHVAASTPALVHDIDSHWHHQAGDVIRPGVVELTPQGTFRVPEGPGLGVELDVERFEAAKASFREHGSIPIMGDDPERHTTPPVKSQW